jgi:MYXO-CTERM domain-containing protein
MTRIAFGLAAVAAIVVSPSLARAQDASVGCGNIGYIGCCVDDTHSKYCSNGKISSKTCSGTKPLCGWNLIGSTTNYGYSCGTTKDSDPSGKYKRLCTEIPDGGAVPDPDWSVKTDKGTPKTEAGVKVEAGPVVPCGAITSLGCCEDDSTSKYCVSGTLKSKTCTGSTPKCGWSKTGYYCTTTTDSDPSGVNPRLCSQVVAKDGGTTQKDGSTTKTDTGGSTTDTGSTTKKDTGSTTKKDTGSTTKPKAEDEGCGCSVSSPGSAGILLLVVGLFFGFSLVRRRRR